MVAIGADASLLSSGGSRCDTFDDKTTGGVACTVIDNRLVQARLVSGMTVFDAEGVGYGISPRFKLQLTENGPAPRTVAGYEVGGISRNQYRFFQHTITSIGQLAPTSGSAPSPMSGTRAGRGIVLQGRAVN
jgi:hypothetical protein